MLVLKPLRIENNNLFENPLTAHLFGNILHTFV